MKGWPVVAALSGVGLALLLVGSGASAVTYPQPGYDAGRTGAVPFELPLANDTAFEIELPGTPTGTVAIDGSTAYVVTLDHGIEVDNETLDENALWSIDLDTAEMTKRFEVFDDRPPASTAFTDGERVYTQVGRTVTAYDLDGEEQWTWPVAENLPGAETVTCGNDPAIADERMYLACIEERPRPSASEVPETAVQVAALERSTGDEAWVWTERLDRDPGANARRERAVPSEERDLVTVEISASEGRVVLHGLAYERGGDRLLYDEGPGAYQRFFELFGIDASDGLLLWSRAGPIETRAWNGDGTGCLARDTLDGAKPVTTASRVFVGFGPNEPVPPCPEIDDPAEPEDPPEEAIHAMEPTSGDDIWEPVGSTDAIELHGSHAMASREGVLLAASEQTLTRIDAPRGSVDWRLSLGTADQLVYGDAPIVLDGERAIVQTLRYDPRSPGYPPVVERLGYGLQAVDVNTGEPFWHHGLFTDVGDPDRSYAQPGFGPDLIVAPQADGRVRVLGTTDVSMGGPDVDTERFPDVGEEVRLDLSDTEPGAFGEASRYRVDWGDGTVTGWRSSSRFHHTYEEEGEQTARLTAGNDANQTASTFVTMRVGQTEPNFVETAFRQENQDMTFGVLGVLLALGGGLVGVGSRYRRRSRLEEELEALEEGFEETKANPGECEAYLDNRKARARSLAVDGYLREDQVPVVENRADELQRRLRMDALDEEFAFLPHSLVKRGQEMLEDGQVSSLEAEAFLAALEEDEILTDEQRAMVRERIHAWRGRDSGGSQT